MEYINHKNDLYTKNNFVINQKLKINFIKKLI